MTRDQLEYLLHLEELAWEANRKGDADFYSTYLTDDALAVASQGRYDKATILATMAQKLTSFTSMRVHGPQLRVLAPDAMLLSYQATVDAPSNAGPVTFGLYATTVYVRREGVWYAAFNQLTPM